MGLLDKIEKSVKDIPSEAKSEKQKSKFLTNVDKIYYKVNETGNITLKDLAVSLGLSLKQTEDYAKLLDKEGLAKLYYPAVGSPRLTSIEQRKEKLKPANKNLRLLIFTIIVVITIAIIVFLLQKGVLLRF